MCIMWTSSSSLHVAILDQVVPVPSQLECCFPSQHFGKSALVVPVRLALGFSFSREWFSYGWKTRLLGSGGVPWSFDAGLSQAAKIEEFHSEHEFELAFTTGRNVAKFKEQVTSISIDQPDREEPGRMDQSCVLMLVSYNLLGRYVEAVIEIAACI